MDSEDVEESQEYRQLLEKIRQRSAIVGVIGLGYVGLPLASTFHSAGYATIGFDADMEVISALERGQSYLEHLPNSTELFRQLSESDKFYATSDMLRLQEVDAILICVPTPLGENFEPDLRYIESCGRSIAAARRPGQLVVLESTTYPGTTREKLLPWILEGDSGSKLGREVFVAFSPEREDPGNKIHQMASIPKLVGGLDISSSNLAAALYESSFEQVIRVRSAEVAEAAKIVENVYRSVNIALVNELKMVLNKMNIDIWEVLDAAQTKPFGFHRFDPGPGWGGHCIPVDPFYLAWKARAVGVNSTFILHAGEINTQMPSYVVQHVQSALNHDMKPLNGSKILLLGIAYKADLGDTRESPAFVIWKLLEESKAAVSYYDPLVPKIKGHLSSQFQFLKGRTGISDDSLPVELASSDCVVVITPHSFFKQEETPPGGRPCSLFAALKSFTGPVVDTRNWVPASWGLKVYKA